MPMQTTIIFERVLARISFGISDFMGASDCGFPIYYITQTINAQYLKSSLFIPCFFLLYKRSF